MGRRWFHTASLTFVVLLLSISKNIAQVTPAEKHIEVSLRMIGHQVLLNSNDSTSLVLPIIKENDHYKIQFEKEFEFIPDELVSIVNQVFADTKMAKGYLMEVEKCETGEIVYSFEMKNEDAMDIIQCKLRAQPQSCYNLLITLMEEQASLYATTPTLQEKSHFRESRIYYYTIASLAALLVGLFFFLWRRRNSSESDPNVISLGKYRFDKRKSELIIEEQRIELTNKEADLLLLLYNAVNTTVEREVILNVVWGDEGDYVGRTLDVFISKLRKKLDYDSSLKIANTRGVGYKLVMDS
jgi:hypothetical protein